MTERIETRLGDLITLLYEEYLDLYEDEDLASVATAATINELLSEQQVASHGEDIEAA